MEECERPISASLRESPPVECLFHCSEAACEVSRRSAPERCLARRAKETKKQRGLQRVVLRLMQQREEQPIHWGKRGLAEWRAPRRAYCPEEGEACSAVRRCPLVLQKHRYKTVKLSLFRLSPRRQTGRLGAPRNSPTAWLNCFQFEMPGCWGQGLLSLAGWGQRTFWFYALVQLSS